MLAKLKGAGRARKISLKSYARREMKPKQFYAYHARLPLPVASCEFPVAAASFTYFFIHAL